MQTNPDLEPTTKEIWAGVRSPASARSDFANEAAGIRARISGIDAYQRFLEQSSVDSFDSYESELKNEASDLVDDSEVEAARDVVEPEFSSFSDFTGDPSTPSGIFDKVDYDEYREYLINNGVGNVDADNHNQVIQDIFTADRQFIENVENNITNYTQLNNYLQNIGYSSSKATNIVNKIQNNFSSFSNFKTALTQSNSLNNFLSKFKTNQSGVRGVSFNSSTNTLYLRANEIRMEQTGNTSNQQQQTSTNPSANISFLGLTFSDNPVDALETTTASVDVENTGSADGTVTATITANNTRLSSFSRGEVVNGTDNKQITVPAGGTRTVSFDIRFNTVGKYSVNINNSLPGELEVTYSVP